MYHFVIELQNRPDGLVNSTINAYSSLAVGLSQFYSRCAAAVSSTSYTSVTVILCDQHGNIIENKNLETLYEE